MLWHRRKLTSNKSKRQRKGFSYILRETSVSKILLKGETKIDSKTTGAYMIAVLFYSSRCEGEEKVHYLKKLS